MPFAAGVKFKENGFSRYYHPGSFELSEDDFCWVRDEAVGVERIGFVSCMEGRAEVQMGHLPRVLRLATEEEVEAWYDIKIRERQMIEETREAVAAHNLNIKVSDVVWVADKRQVIVQFTSERRIDFRELVRDLAGRFKARIEMWQISARKEAGIQNGLGICGNPLCCGNWMKDFPSISMRFAKEQDIVQPPSKLSGPCGKLRCCLRYEHETYLALADGVATTGCRGCASGGACGVVVDRNLISREYTVRRDEGGLARVPFSEFTPDEPVKTDRRTRRGAPTPDDEYDEAPDPADDDAPEMREEGGSKRRLGAGSGDEANRSDSSEGNPSGETGRRRRRSRRRPRPGHRSDT